MRRETLETAAVVTRVAPSFLRFGHFEHFAHHDQHAQLQTLVAHTLQHHFPDCSDAAEMLATVARRTAELVAHWQAIGFCHGVMNTDNMSMLGLTIDYGPFGFLDAFDPGHVCNHSDHQGRYAYARQPNVAFWNLHALAQALLPVIGSSEAALAALEPYRDVFPAALLARLRAKLGLATEHDDDRTLADDLLKLMADSRADFTITFRRLAGFVPGTRQRAPCATCSWTAPPSTPGPRVTLRGCRPKARWTPSVPQRMNAVNPAVVLRNHLAEQAIRQAREGDFSEVQRLLKVLQTPFDEPAQAADAGFPPAWAQHLEVSCSS